MDHYYWAITIGTDCGQAMQCAIPARFLDPAIVAGTPWSGPRPPSHKQLILLDNFLPTGGPSIANKGTVADCMYEVDRKSTRLNSSHRCISYAVFCLKKK